MTLKLGNISTQVTPCLFKCLSFVAILLYILTLFWNAAPCGEGLPTITAPCFLAQYTLLFYMGESTRGFQTFWIVHNNVGSFLSLYPIVCLMSLNHFVYYVCVINIAYMGRGLHVFVAIVLSVCILCSFGFHNIDILFLCLWIICSCDVCHALHVTMSLLQLIPLVCYLIVYIQEFSVCVTNK